MAGLLFFSAAPAVSGTPAKPYLPTHAVRVFTESTLRHGPLEGPSGVFWRIMSEPCEGGSDGVAFYHPGSDDPVCCLVPAGTNSGLYLADGARFTHAVTADDLMMFPGFSVPCDILPVTTVCSNADPDIIEIRRQAGERTFIEQFQVDCITVTRADALAQGWIREPAGDAETLVMIRVTSLRNGENVARQLWIPGGTWWLYEETPHRRSWQLR